jgi:hypothetical protein
MDARWLRRCRRQRPHVVRTRQGEKPDELRGRDARFVERGGRRNRSEHSRRATAERRLRELVPSARSMVLLLVAMVRRCGGAWVRAHHAHRLAVEVASVGLEEPGDDRKGEREARQGGRDGAQLPPHLPCSRRTHHPVEVPPGRGARNPVPWVVLRRVVLRRPRSAEPAVEASSSVSFSGTTLVRSMPSSRIATTTYGLHGFSPDASAPAAACWTSLIAVSFRSLWRSLSQSTWSRRSNVNFISSSITSMTRSR